MRRVALGLLVVAACGDNEPSCGHVEVVLGLRNVWATQFGVDDMGVYYADYDVDGYGTQFLMRMNHEGGGLRAIATRPAFFDEFGNGLAYDATNVYWTGSSAVGYSFYASPVAGGPLVQLAQLSECTPYGVAVNATETFAGTEACGDDVSKVYAVANTDGATRAAWTAGIYDGDVRALAATDDTLYIGTTVALFSVRAGVTQVVNAQGAVRHIEIHNGTPVFSVEDVGVYVGRDLVYAYADVTKGEGAFSLDGDNLYVAEPPQLMFSTLSDKQPRVAAKNMGVVGKIVAHGGYAYWSQLVMPGTVGVLGSFSGGISRVSRPCD